jgi:Tol biopolymer transport system component
VETLTTGSKRAALLGVLIAATAACQLAPRPATEPMGQLPAAETTAVPQWIPFRVRAGQARPDDPREVRIANLRQLTDDDHSGGAVWDPEGRAIVYEKRGADGCAQLHRIDLETGKTRRVSPASGWASSPAFGSDGVLLFAYAREATAPCLRATLGAGALGWSLAASDIWSLADPQAEATPFITHAASYDGDIGRSADGSLVFSSTRDGDPDLYVAGADGHNVERVTRSAGYDGGASFSPDGSSIAWHAEPPSQSPEAPRPTKAAPTHATPSSLRIHLAGSRGQHVRALSGLGRYDIAPTFLPTGDRILFASDYDETPAHSGRGFDLYLRDPDAPNTSDGKPLIERVTHHEGFDGEAHLSPDGRWLLFTSNRHAKIDGGINVYVARWLDRD